MVCQEGKTRLYGAGKTSQLHIRINPEDLRRYQDLAAALGLSLSDFVLFSLEQCYQQLDPDACTHAAEGDVGV